MTPIEKPDMTSGRIKIVLNSAAEALEEIAILAAGTEDLEHSHECIELFVFQIRQEIQRWSENRL